MKYIIFILFFAFSNFIFCQKSKDCSSYKVFVEKAVEDYMKSISLTPQFKYIEDLETGNIDSVKIFNSSIDVFLLDTVSSFSERDLASWFLDVFDIKVQFDTSNFVSSNCDFDLLDYQLINVTEFKDLDYDSKVVIWLRNLLINKNNAVGYLTLKYGSGKGKELVYSIIFEKYRCNWVVNSLKRVEN